MNIIKNLKSKNTLENDFLLIQIADILSRHNVTVTPDLVSEISVINNGITHAIAFLCDEIESLKQEIDVIKCDRKPLY